MKLAGKTLLGIGVTLTVFIVLFALLSETVIVSSFSRMEENEARLNSERVLAALENEFAVIDYTTRDWAFWDDTYTFVQDNNPRYSLVNLGNGTVQTLRMNVLLFYDRENRLVAAREYNPSDPGTPRLLPGVIPWVNKTLTGMDIPENGEGVHGFLILPDNKVFLLDFQPILHSDTSGPAEGTLVMGRAFSDEKVHDLSLYTGIPVTLAVPVSWEKDVFLPLTAHGSQWMTSVSVMNESLLLSSSSIMDNEGNPVLRLSVTTPRAISREGKNVFFFFILAFCILSVLLGGAILIILRTIVIRPIEVVTRQIHACEEGPAGLSRGSIRGSDELALLSSSIREQEEALRFSEIRYRTIFENTGTAMLIVDRDGRPLLSNSEFRNLLGYSNEEIEGWSGWDHYINPEDHERVAEYHRLRLVDPDAVPHQYESGIIDRNGRKKAAIFTVAIIPGTTLSVISLFDITTLHEAKEAVRQSEARYRAIVEDQSELIIRSLPDGTIRFVNDAFCRFFGKNREDLLGCMYFPDIPEDDRRHVDTVIASLQPGAEVGSIEHRVILPAGGERWMQWNHRAFFDPDGRLMEYQSVGRDITAQKRIEEIRSGALEQIHQNMEQFQVLNDQIRNPLQGIIGVADLDNGPFSKRILDHAREIDAILMELDRGWVRSSKVREFLRKHDKGGEYR